MVDLSMSIIGTTLREYMSVDWIVGVNVVSLGINNAPLQCKKSCVGWDTV
jgi:general stress protein CsbA